MLRAMNLSDPMIAADCSPTIRAALDGVLRRFAHERTVERLWARDPSLWHPSEHTQATIARRLGWLDLHDRLPALIGEARGWLDQIRAARVVLVAPGYAGLHARLWLDRPDRRAAVLLDRVDPRAVQSVLASVDRGTSALLVAGETTPALESLRRAALDRGPWALAGAIGPDATAQSVTRLPIDVTVGERFGALAVYGVVAALLAGDQPETWIDAVRRMHAACHADAAANPGVQLGALLGVLAQQGRDRLTFVASDASAPLGRWIAGLIAGSLSKHRRGFVPIVSRNMPSDRAGRAIVVLHAPGEANTPTPESSLRPAMPIITIDVGDRTAWAAQIVLWQVAVATAALVIGLNPFDQPDTDGFNAELARRLDRGDSTTAALDPPTRLRDEQMRLTAASWLMLASYLPPDPAIRAELDTLRSELERRFRRPVAIVEPLRDPFATQVLHAGRADGVVIALASGDAPEIPAWLDPIRAFSRARLALDRLAWRRMERATIAIDVGRDPIAALRLLRE